MDMKSPEERSKNMAAIRSKNTKSEIYLKKYNTAIFIHSCFWHRHSGCQYAYMPKARVEFWQKKFQVNINRDNVIRMEL
ncbi:MAG: hypothetical protein HFG28_11870 [Eubacterium sp.]|nr:hypothetical protein [Eubacterium sp.]